MGLAIQHPGLCIWLLLLNLVLLALSLSGLSLGGLAFDVILHGVDPSRPPPRGVWGIHPPASWTPWTAIIAIAVAIIAIAAFQTALRYIAAVAQANLVQAVQTRLRAGVYDKIQRLSFRFFDTNETGSIINRATGDVAGIAMFAQFALIDVLMLVITMLVYLVYMVSIHRLLTVVCLATTPLLALTSVYFTKMLRPAFEQNRRLYDWVLLTASENLQGQHVIKGFGLADEENRKFHAVNDDYRYQQRWIFHRSSMYSTIIGSLTQLNIVIALAYGGYLVIDNQIQLGTGLIVFTTLLQGISNQVVTIAERAATMQSSLTAAQRVYDVFAAPLEISSPPDAVPLKQPKGRVEFQAVSFGYDPAEPVLHGVSLAVEPGKCVALVGPTGAGKSTLVSLVPRFYDPTAGRVLIDGIDARRINLDDLRRSIGMVFQENFLFSNTIAANIAFGWPDAPRDRIEKAAKIAAAHGFITAMPDGYDTVIGEYGSNLSGGQRQRLAIARAVLLEPSILILDDATAAIDPETEGEILEAMDNAIRGRTTLVIASRLSTLRAGEPRGRDEPGADRAVRHPRGADGGRRPLPRGGDVADRRHGEPVDHPRPEVVRGRRGHAH